MSFPFLWGLAYLRGKKKSCLSGLKNQRTENLCDPELQMMGPSESCSAKDKNTCAEISAAATQEIEFSVWVQPN